MFTPNRSRSSASGVNARRSVTSLTPRSSAYKSQRTSLLRRSLAPATLRTSAVSNASSILGASPSTTRYFGSEVHSIQAYDSSLPVSVTECIALSEDVGSLSVQIGRNGWAWLIDGNNLFVWPLKLTGVIRSSVCREVKLPSNNDCSFTADLISVASGGNVTVVAVSTMGKVLVWGNVLTSTSYNEGTLDINSQSEACYKVVALENNGFIVVTTTGTLFHVGLNRGVVQSTHLHTAKGMLARFGRRVSSFIFTPQQNPTVVQMLSNKNNREIIILTDSTLQQWRSKVTTSNVTSCELKHEIDLQLGLVEKVSHEIWKTSKPGVQIWPLDVQLATRRHHLAVLVAATDTEERSPTILHYAVCLLDDDLGKCEVFVLEHTGLYDKNNVGEELSYKLVVENPSNRTLQHFSICSNQLVVLKSVFPNKNNAREDSVPFNSQGDSLLSCGEVEGSYVFLSSINGLLTCSTSLHSNLPPTLESSILSTATPNSVVLDRSKGCDSLPGSPQVTQARMAQLEASENNTQRLQAAFLHFCRKNLMQSQSLIDESFKDADSSLDDAVVMMSRDILDDFPASDPRWAESLPYAHQGEAGGGSLILFHQLEDKQSAHNLFISFLNEIGIWSKLNFYLQGRERKSSRSLVREHAEKLCSAIALLQHNSNQGIIDCAIKRVLSGRGNVVNINSLTHKDYFYREVSKIEDIFEYLLEEEEKCLQNSQLTSRDRVNLISGVGSIFEAMLTCAKQYRKSHSSVSEQNLSSVSREFKPWTIESGRINIRSILLQQNKASVERGIPECEDSQQRFDLFQSLVTLSDLLLDDFSLQLESSSESRWSEVNAEFEKVRSQLLSPLLQSNQVEQCSYLAEKYKDFDALIQVCGRQNDNEKVMKYMEQYSEEGFPEHLFKWYLKNKQYSDLLQCCGENEARQLELSNFLKVHPKLAWMHEVKTGNYTAACDSLKYLANSETVSLSKKKVYLSLGKLAAVFSGSNDVEDKIADVTRHHNLLKYQQSLPFDLLEYHRVDKELVIPATELIKMYVGQGSHNSNEHNFKKAFEIVEFIDLDPQRNNEDDMDPENSKTWWNLYVWCQAVLRDSWQDIDPTSDPFLTCSHTVLFKVLKLAHETNSLEEILPDVDDLLNRDELDSIAQNPSLEYFIRASFERVKRTYVSS